MNKKVVTKLDSNYVKQYDIHMKRQKRRQSRLVRRLVLFSGIVLLIAGSITTYHMNQRGHYAERQERYEYLEGQLNQLKDRETELLEEIEFLSDEAYVLEIARSNYFLSKEGELIFKVPDEESTY